MWGEGSETGEYWRRKAGYKKDAVQSVLEGDRLQASERVRPRNGGRLGTGRRLGGEGDCRSPSGDPRDGDGGTGRARRG